MLLMLVFSMVNQSAQESTVGPVQTTEKTVKKRSQEDKVGRHKYNQQLLKRVLAEIQQIRETQRVILNGLKGAGYFHFSMPMLQKTSCVDQVDVEILEAVHEAGVPGIYPKDVASQLKQYGLRHWHVSRRILRMNKRLEHETGEKLFEKRGWKWALTRFAFDVWGETEAVEGSGESQLL
jgi:hypothetical protein